MPLGIDKEEALQLGGTAAIVGTGLALGTITLPAAGVVLGVRLLDALLSGNEETTQASQEDAHSSVYGAQHPLQWVIGDYVRVGGYIPIRRVSPGGKRLDLACVLSEGSLAIPAGRNPYIWLNGYRVRLILTPGGWYEPVGGSIWAGGVRVYFNFAADGTQGTEFINAPGVLENEWRIGYLRNESWAHVILNDSNPGIAGNVNNKEGKPRLDGPPTLSFEGLQGIALPDHTGGNRQRSADITRVANWLLLDRMGLDPSEIDAVTAAAALAYTVANSRATVTSVGDHSLSFDRYAFNGVVRSTDNPVALLRAIQFIWSGVSGWDGSKIQYLPGRSAAGVGSITADDIIKVSTLIPAPNLKERVNGVSMDIQTSRDAGGHAESIGAVINPTLLAIDTRQIIRHLPAAAYVNSYGQGKWLLQVKANKLAQRGKSNIVIPVTDDNKLWRVGDVITIDEPSLNWVGKDFEIDALFIDRDEKELTLALREAPPSTTYNLGDYADYVSPRLGDLPAFFDTTNPSILTNAKLTLVDNGYILQWDQPDDEDYAATEIFDREYNNLNDPDDYDETFYYVSNNNYFQRLGLFANVRHVLIARHIDNFGNRSVMPYTIDFTTIGKPGIPDGSGKVVIGDDDLIQYAYRRTETDQAPAVDDGADNTAIAENRANDDFTPNSWERDELQPLPPHIYVWRISRSRQAVGRPWTKWLEDGDGEPEKIGQGGGGSAVQAVQHTQYCYWLGREGGVVQPLGMDSDAQKTTEEYLPTYDGRACSVQPQPPTETLPALWLFTRTYSTDATLATAWQPLRVVDTWEAPGPAVQYLTVYRLAATPPGLPTAKICLLYTSPSPRDS